MQEVFERNSVLAKLCQELIINGNDKGILIRALGSVGFYLKLQKHYKLYSYYRKPLGDIDIIIRKDNVFKLEGFFNELGFTENNNFKMLFGYQRRVYNTSNGITIEVYLDDLYLCQKIVIQERIYLDNPTLCYTDLFLSKIQRVNLTLKDIFDLTLLLDNISIVNKDPEGLNILYLQKLCAKDWHWWKTLNTNLLNLLEQPNIKFINHVKLKMKINTILNGINSNKKSLKWHIRNILGDKIRWYDHIE